MRQFVKTLVSAVWIGPPAPGVFRLQDDAHTGSRRVVIAG